MLLFAGSAYGQEKRIDKSELPSAVQKTVEEQSKGATVLGFAKEMENGKPYYEAQLRINGHTKDVSMDADGNIAEIEEEVSMDALPLAVRDSLQARAETGTLKKVESLTKHGTLVAYEAQVFKAGKHSEIQVGPSGEVLRHPE